MKKQPKQKKLSLGKETIRRLSASELEQVRGGDPTELPMFPDQQDIGTYRECVL